MALTKLIFKPGLNRESTIYANEGGWYDGDKIRFRSGFPEKIGGWVQLAASQFLGICRSLWNWVDLSGNNNYLGVGTNLKYYIEEGNTYYDITPIRKITNPMTNNPFSTAYSTLSANINATAITLTLTSTAAAHTTGDPVGCSTILVTDASNGATQNDFVTFSGATGPFGGFTAAQINVEQQVFNVVSINTYTINIAGVFSTSATSGGGAAVVATYQINTGLDVYVIGTGWGAGPWGSGGWGSASPTSTIGEQLLLWTNDNFGQDLIIAQRGGAIYYWQALLGPSTRAQSLQYLSTYSGFQGQFVPNRTNQIISSSIQEFAIAFGANPYDPTNANTTFDPMLVRWSDQANAYQWVPSVTNQSGEYRLSNGSYIMGARATRQEILIWTDSALYSMQYVGTPYIWGFNILMDNISVMSPNSMITINNVTYWMGKEKFYQYSGVVQTLPSTLRQYVFDDINQSQAFQVFAGANEGYNEVWWFYCSANSNQVDKYVIYNYLEQTWAYGTMGRTAWLDTGIKAYPVAADYNSRLLYHEVGNDDVSTEVPAPIDAYAQSSDFDIGDGNNFGFVWRILPDVNFNGSSANDPYVTMTVRPRQNSGSPYTYAAVDTAQSSNNYTVAPEYTVQQFTGQVYTRLRGRQMAFRIESNSLGVAWQLGAPRIDVRPDGRR
jgi:hypothetical protein